MHEQEMVRQAKESFEKLLLNEKYGEIIQNEEHLKLLLGMLPIKQEDVILDVGTGTGYLAFPLAKGNKDCHVIGLDIAETVIWQNKAKAEAEQIENLQFCSFDGIHYPFGTESVDIITTRYAFHHFPDIRAAVKQLVELVRINGKILISDPVRNPSDKNRVIDKFMKVKGDGHIGFYLPEEVRKLFSEYGVQVVQSEMSKMHFPFPQKKEYIKLFEVLSDEEKALYNLHKNDDIIWVGNIEVYNVLLEKSKV